MIASAADRHLVRTWNSGLSAPLDLVVLATADPRTAQLAEFAAELAALADRLRVVQRAGDPARPPALQIGGWRYHGLPRQRELSPFLKLLGARDPNAPPLTASVREFLCRIDRPARLEVYVTPECLHCPFVVSALAPLPFANPHLGIDLYDLSLFPERAATRGIQAVPMVLFGDSFRWTGTLRIQKVLEAVARGVEADPEFEQMVSLLKSGAAERLAALMLERDRLFPGFAELVVHREWSVRVGAMVVLETIAAENRRLARRILAPLWDRRDTLDRSQQGDLIYLIGELADSTWRDRLTVFLDTAHDPELVEVAEEALGKIAD